VATEALRAEPTNSLGSYRNLRFTELNDEMNDLGQVTRPAPVRAASTQGFFSVPSSKSEGAENAPGKQESINAVIEKIDEKFAVVKAATSGRGFRMNIPIVLCPKDVLYEGTAIEIGIDRRDGYTGLRVSKRTPSRLPPEIEDTINSVLEWVDSL
jgi:hypothetical protein